MRAVLLLYWISVVTIKIKEVGGNKGGLHGLFTYFSYDFFETENMEVWMRIFYIWILKYFQKLVSIFMALS